jgi:hypothetical protein
MFALKSCPRCRGDLYQTLDDEIACIQCGYNPRPEESMPVLARVRGERTSARARAA